MALKSRIFVMMLILGASLILAGAGFSDEATPASDAETTSRFDPANSEVMILAGGDDKKGKYLFKKNCKKCHTEDGEGGELTPVTNIMEAWEEIFSEDVHFGEEIFSETFKEKDLKIIEKFLIKYAADSEQPMTCG